jgi:hypothetical protein
MQVCRGGFTVKLMKLKLQGPSRTCAPSKALGGGPNKYSLLCLILFFFNKEGPKNCIRFRSHKTWNSPVRVDVGYLTSLEAVSLMMVQSREGRKKVWYKLKCIYIELISVFCCWLTNMELQMHGTCSTFKTGPYLESKEPSLISHIMHP